MAELTRSEVQRLQSKAESGERQKRQERSKKKGLQTMLMVQGAAFVTGYARGRVGDGDRLQIGSLPIPLDLVGAALGIGLGLRKGKGALPAMALGNGALASFLSHEGNKVGQRAKARGGIIGGAAGMRGLIGNQYDLIGNQGTGMGQGGAASYAKNAW